LISLDRLIKMCGMLHGFLQETPLVDGALGQAG
jgi:hypothetical protein